jgi:hypothetical protein
MERPLHGGVVPRDELPEGPRRGFNFTYHIERLCSDAAQRLPELKHIDMTRVATAFAQARKRTSYGLYASLTPMRFEGGSLLYRRGRRQYTVQRLFTSDGCEIMYILTFYLPRFMDLNFREKLTTIFHELWHVSPQFDGDLRRHGGRCYAHTHSQKQYDARMEQLAARYLASAPPGSLYEFLNLRFAELHQRYGRVYGAKVRRPKLLPVEG